MPTQVIMPQLGESVVEGTVSRWLKQEGESIEELESLLEVNTDKVDSEIPSPAGGVVLKILVPEGQTVRAGTVLAWIGKPGEAVAGQPDSGTQQAADNLAPEVSSPGAEKSAQAIQETVEGKTRPVPAAGRDRELGFISPLVARMAQEHNLDLTQIQGTGQGGRITKKDVLAHLEETSVSTVAAPAQEVPSPWETPGEGDLFRPTEMVFKQARNGEESRSLAQPPALPAQQAKVQPAAAPGRLVPLSTMRRKIADHMVQSIRTAPHVTTVMEANLQPVFAHYQANKPVLARDGVHLTYTAYFAAATAQALRAVPLVNSSWTDDGILIHPTINLGIAVSLGEEGLIVPVIKNADNLSLVGLARAIKDLGDRARSRALQPEEVRDGTFTITNHGISGSLVATPIINQPQCGILGVGAIQKRVVVTREDAIAVRPMVYLSFTFDHRILDGASADGFLAKVVEGLEGWN